MKGKIKKLISITLALALVVSGIVFSPQKEVMAATKTRTNFVFLANSSVWYTGNNNYYYKVNLKAKRRIFTSSAKGSAAVGTQDKSTLWWKYNSNASCGIKIRNYDNSDGTHNLNIQLNAKSAGSVKFYLGSYEKKNNKEVLKTLTETLTIKVINIPKQPVVTDFAYTGYNNQQLRLSGYNNTSTYYCYNCNAELYSQKYNETLEENKITPIVSNYTGDNKELYISTSNDNDIIYTGDYVMPKIGVKTINNFKFIKRNTGSGYINITPHTETYYNDWQGYGSDEKIYESTGATKKLNIQSIGDEPSVTKSVTYNHTGNTVKNPNNVKLGYNNNDSLQIHYNFNGGGKNNAKLVLPETFYNQPDYTFVDFGYIGEAETSSVANFKIKDDVNVRNDIRNASNNNNYKSIIYSPYFEYTNEVIKQKCAPDDRNDTAKTTKKYPEDNLYATTILLTQTSDFDVACHPSCYYLEYDPSLTEKNDEYNREYKDDVTGKTYFCKKVYVGELDSLKSIYGTRDNIYNSAIKYSTNRINKWYIDSEKGIKNITILDDSLNIIKTGKDSNGYYIQPTDNINSGECTFMVTNSDDEDSKNYTFYKTAGFGKEVLAVKDQQIEILKKIEGSTSTYSYKPTLQVCTNENEVLNNNIKTWVNGYIDPQEFKYSSSKDGIVSINETTGEITGLNAGETVITATKKEPITIVKNNEAYKKDVSFKISVIVHAPTEEIAFQDRGLKDDYKVSIGENIDLKKMVEVVPSQESSRKFRFEIMSGQNLASINTESGVLQAKSIGEVQVRVSTTDGTNLSADCTVIITTPPPKNIKFESIKEGTKISWSAVKDAGTYTVYKREGLTGEWEKSETNETTYIDVDAKFGQDNYYYITSTPKESNVDDFESLPSEIHKYKLKVNAPKIKSITKEGSRAKITISGDKYDGYVLYYGTSKNPTTVQATFSAKTAEISLPKHGVYYFRVKAYATQDDKNYYSDYSNQVKFDYTNTTTSTTLKGTVTPTVKKTQITIKIGNKKLKITNSVAKKIKFKSSNKKVLTISKKGKIKYKKKGKATVSFTYNKKKYKIKFTIKKKGKKKFKVTAKFNKRKYKFTVKRK